MIAPLKKKKLENKFASCTERLSWLGIQWLNEYIYLSFSFFFNIKNLTDRFHFDDYEIVFLGSDKQLVSTRGFNT